MNADRLDQLMARMRAGDDAAYGQFLAKAADRLRADLRRKVPSEDVLEDVVRQCLIAVHRKRHTLGDNRPAGPWLHAIGRYVMVGYRSQPSQAPARRLEAQAETANGMVRLVNLEKMADKGSAARSEAIIADMILRLRRAVQRNPHLAARHDP